jgi:ABC-type transport system involved in Fe-S cluster assembly fused permease/ATPase subunit
MENAQFSGNYAKAKLKDKYGIIDGSGKWIIPATYSNLGNVSTMISFQKGKKWGFIDLTNKIVLKPIFDEATSALDVLTEHSVMEAVYNLSDDTTVIIIAHRLPTLKRCDNIWIN